MRRTCSSQTCAQQLAVRHRDTATGKLVSVVNSETGWSKSVAPIVEIGRRHAAVILIDAAQAVGRLPVDAAALDVDYLTFSSHKLHAPHGTGALLTKPRVTPPTLLFGGGQESGYRAGTENLRGIAGLGVACEARRQNLAVDTARMAALRDRFEHAVLARCGDIVVNGSALRVPNTSNLRFSGVDGQALVAQLDRKDIASSQASACSSHRPEASAVLRAMELSEEEAFQSVRLSFSILNTDDEVDQHGEIHRLLASGDGARIASGSGERSRAHPSRQAPPGARPLPATQPQLVGDPHQSEPPAGYDLVVVLERVSS